MSQKSRTQNSTHPRGTGGLWLFLLLLGGVLAVLFWRSFHPAWVQFANDGPLGAMMSDRLRLPAAFGGTWGELNGYGIREPGAMPNVTFLLLWLLGPLGFAKFYPPLTLLILGACAWFCFRQLGLGTPAAVLGGLAAALSPDFFNVACWGVGPQAICFGMNYLALGVVAGPQPLRSWVRYPLAGLAVGLGVMEGYDIGAIFSVVTALLIVVRAGLQDRAPFAGLAKGAAQVGVMAVFAAFMAAAALSGLIATQIEGVAGMSKEERTRDEQWAWATQLGSMPKLETLGVVVPGLFGYRMDTPDGGAYWGRSGRHPGWDSYFASGKQGPPPNAGIRFGGAGPYAGILVLMISLWTVVQSCRKASSPFTVPERRFIWFLCAGIVISLLLSFGRHAPFYKLFFSLPYASTIRIPGKFYHVVQWLLLMVFAFGLHGMSRLYLEATLTTPRSLTEQWRFFWSRVGSFERKWVIGCAVAVGVAAVAWLGYAGSRETLVAYLQEVQFDAATSKAIAGFSIRQAGWFVLLFAMAAALFGLVLSGYFAGKRAVIGVALLGVFLVIDLARVGSHWVNPYNWKDRYLETSDNAVFQLLREKPHEKRVAIWPFGLPGQFAIIQQVYGTEWLQHLFQYYNIQSLDIIQMPRMPQDIAAFETALAYDNASQNLHRIVRRWELTNTRYLIGPAGLYATLNKELDPQQRFRPLLLFELYQMRAGGPILTRTNSTGPFAVFEFTGALPRVQLYGNWQHSPDDEATLAQLASKEFDPTRTVLVAEPLPAPKEGASPIGGSVQFQRYSPKRIQLSAQAGSPSVLLLNDKHDPNWKVFVDDHPAPLLRCNFIMRGVFLEPGPHTVEFRFEPPLLGLKVSLAAIALGLGLLGLAWFDSRWRRGRSVSTNDKPA